MKLNLDAISERSVARVVDRLSPDAPGLESGGAGAGAGALQCPFCDRPLTLRRSVLGRLNPVPETGERPHVDGVQLKCAGDDGCAFRPDFDVPLVEGRGYWPELDHRAEYERELDLRNGNRVIDVGYTPGAGQSLQERLEALGYLK